MPPFRIILIDSDDERRQRVNASLSHVPHWKVRVQSGLGNGLPVLARTQHDAVIFGFNTYGRSINQPLEDIRAISAASPKPLIIATNTFDEAARVTFLRSGIEDIFDFPVDPLLLVAKLEAFERRKNKSHVCVTRLSDQIEVNPYRKDVSVAGHYLGLLPTEYAVFEAMQADAGKAVPTKTLWAALDKRYASRSLMLVHMCRIRKKLDAASGNDKLGSQLIQTVRGYGFMLAATPLPLPRAQNTAPVRATEVAPV